jgi:hypothetical protein
MEEEIPSKGNKIKLFLFEAMFVLIIAAVVAGTFYFDEIMTYLSK